MSPSSIPQPSSARRGALASIWGTLGSSGLVAPEVYLTNPDAGTMWGPVSLTDPMAHSIVRRGVSSKTLGPLGDLLGLELMGLAGYLDLPPRMMGRLVATDLPLPTHAAVSVVRLLQLDQMATATFESDREAMRWLHAPHPMLDGESPLVVAKTSFGAQRGKDILVAIQRGGVL